MWLQRKHGTVSWKVTRWSSWILEFRLAVAQDQGVVGVTQLNYFLGGVPVGSPTSTGRFVILKSVILFSPESYSTLQTSTEARLAPLVEYKPLSMCTVH
jgi:hypothetical protein